MPVLHASSRLGLGATVPGLSVPGAAGLPLLHERHCLGVPVLSSRRPSTASRLTAWSSGTQTFGSLTVPRTPTASLNIAHMPDTCSLNCALPWASIPWPSSPLLQTVVISLLLNHLLLLLWGHRSDVWCVSGLAYMWWRVRAAFIWRSGMGMAKGGAVMMREVARVGWIVTVKWGGCIVGGAWGPGAVWNWLPWLTRALVSSQLGVSWSCSKVGRVARVVWVIWWLETTRDPGQL